MRTRWRNQSEGSMVGRHRLFNIDDGVVAITAGLSDYCKSLRWFQNLGDFTSLRISRICSPATCISSRMADCLVFLCDLSGRILGLVRPPLQCIGCEINRSPCFLFAAWGEVETSVFLTRIFSLPFSGASPLLAVSGTLFLSICWEQVSSIEARL